MRNIYPIRINDREFILGRRTWFMGIVNVTPDSFSDGGLFLNVEQAVRHAFELETEGADIIDIGGESTRPGALPVSEKEEIDRVIPVIAGIREKSRIPISIDTTKAAVAQAALDAGADIINDISAMRFDPDMLPLAASENCAVILMHMQGSPQTMQENPTYHDLLKEISCFFEERIESALSAGIEKNRIIIDPGIGFGKRQEDNLNLIRNLRFLEAVDRPILIGTSRKSFLGNIHKLPARDRVEGTIASSLISVLNGAHILRLHDVAAVKRAVEVTERILSVESGSENNCKGGHRAYA